jgi:hypothetical protein
VILLGIPLWGLNDPLAQRRCKQDYHNQKLLVLSLFPGFAVSVNNVLLANRVLIARTAGRDERRSSAPTMAGCKMKRACITDEQIRSEFETKSIRQITSQHHVGIHRVRAAIRRKRDGLVVSECGWR